MTLIGTSAKEEAAPLPVNGGSWQGHLSAAGLSLQALCDQLQLPRGALNWIGASGNAADNFSLRVPAPYLSRIEAGNPRDPLLLQILPSETEFDVVPGYTADPLSESAYNPLPGLIHKYHSRALLLVSRACAIHCRYCFRRHFPYDDNQPAKSQWQPVLDYLRAQKNVNEVIFSGGDPLAANDNVLAWLAEQLATIPHIKRLRIHSRMPVVIPQRIDEKLLHWLANWRGQRVMVIHCNHPNELDQYVAAAIDKLRSIGVTVLNQTVLLQHINDDVDTLSHLSERLFECGALPYYLHQLDAVQGAAHFAVSDARAQRLAGALSAKLPGFLVPRLVRELPFHPAKTPLLPILPPTN